MMKSLRLRYALCGLEFHEMEVRDRQRVHAIVKPLWPTPPSKVPTSCGDQLELIKFINARHLIGEAGNVCYISEYFS